MSAAAVGVQDLTVVAGGRRILHVPELSVQSGEVLAVLGPNGAGKSTLLNVCLGFRRPTAGRVQLLGQPVHQMGKLGRARLRRRVGYVPQELAAHSTLPLTVREVVAIGRSGRAGLFRALKRADWDIIDAWIERMGLGTLRQQPYALLSGGEQRKTLIARAMVQEPQLLMLDEPTAFLDLGWREHIVQTMEQLYADTRPTLIIVCHELEVLPACCRRLVLLDGGEVQADGPPEQVMTTDRIRSLYGAGLQAWHAAGRHAVLPGGGTAPDEAPRTTSSRTSAFGDGGAR